MHDDEDLKRRIVASRLLEQAELETLAEAAANTEGSPGLLQFLTQQGKLTEFEAGALEAGFTGPFMLGPYRVHERIASAQRGDLYRAIHVEFDQPVTLKAYSATQALDPVQLAQMRREIRVAVQLDHPNLIRSFQVSRVGNLYFMAFEDLSGESLATRLSREGALGVEELCRLGNQAALGLESLREAGIVHGDLQPANLWIKENEQLKIMEFGAARDSLSHLDQVEGSEAAPGDAGLALAASPSTDNAYLAPEAVADANAADARSDIYSLGAILYHGLTGEVPSPQADLKQLGERAVVWPPELVETIGRALSANPDERPAPHELSEELARHYDVQSVAVAESWSPEFIAWADEAKLPVDDGSLFNGQNEVSDEFADFTAWLSTKQ